MDNVVHICYEQNRCAEATVTWEESHIDFLSTRNVIWTLGGGGGVAPVMFLGEKSWKISIVC